MAEQMEYIVPPWEIEAYVESLNTSELENVGTKSWLDFHKKLTLLNQQNVLEITGLREESVMEWFISLKKIPILVYEAIQIDIWKHKVFPLLINFNGEPTNTFMLFSIFYHEVIAVSLLENILFHCESGQTLDDTVIDLIDYIVQHVTTLLDGKTLEVYEIKDTDSCLEEIIEKQRAFEFDIGMRCISILHYLIEILDNLPLCAISRMLAIHDVPYLFVQLIENQPWKKQNENDEVLMYEGSWRKIKSSEIGKINKREGQVWFGLRELLLNPKCSPYYEITEHRLSQLSKLQKHLHDDILDQIAPLIELKRWLAYLNISPAMPSSNLTCPVRIEVMPQIKSSILEKYHKKWKKLARHQSKYLFTTDTSYIKEVAQILSDVYDLEKLDRIETKKCSLCQEPSKKRCSRCKEVWYCSRECQVKDWENHKNICNTITKTKQ
ncbi:PREDICTED: zinc finger MYND domain-containing protein 10 [Acromyrmex echinatior]|uniref:Zinc finger MYND domain-containing protein 10 n=1 Tax=Acromyrmex echinatior TaxID=103372 RepID=F4WYW3_ACREC|nr:PREDICTED: zinc finger MYND domain-containing protein 10 [Acromyrmex echinatior]EGI60617.1 Zinc finger MYND domain-containing protein 10 [Acromyrmex echinatior]